MRDDGNISKIKRCYTYRKKAPKPIARTPIKKKPYKIAAKSVFKEHGANSTKTYRRRFTDAQVMAKALECRAERRRDMPPAQQAFNELLDSMGVLYEAEAIFLNGDRWIAVDAYVKSEKMAFELDGFQHDQQKGYDDGRSAWLLRKHGIRVIRFKNIEVFKKPAWVKERVVEALKLQR